MLTGQSATIAEGDPLPPEDHAPPAADDIDLLYRAERPGLLRLLRRRTSADEASDLVQQLFVRFVGLDRSRRASITSPRAYLRQSALNLSTDRARRAARRSAGAHEPLDEACVTAPDQLAVLEARDMLCRLEASLLRLKPRTREIFLAHRIDGYSYVEIAHRTGLSVKGVEKHMSRAIAHIDRFLGAR
jgi:RNA polymerase sigma-70 factor (ECF subfamily)